MRCEDCKWWDRLSEQDIDGFCHRFPPIMAGMLYAGVDAVCTESDMEDVFWPVTQNDDWCGEFKKKES